MQTPTCWTPERVKKQAARNAAISSSNTSKPEETLNPLTLLRHACAAVLAWGMVKGAMLMMVTVVKRCKQFVWLWGPRDEGARGAQGVPKERPNRGAREAQWGPEGRPRAVHGGQGGPGGPKGAGQRGQMWA